MMAAGTCVMKWPTQLCETWDSHVGTRDAVRWGGRTARQLRWRGWRASEHRRRRSVAALILVDGGLEVLLVLGDEVDHVALGFGELHLVHALAGVPVEERLALEHGLELVLDALEDLQNGRVVPDEGAASLRVEGTGVADGLLDVVGNPLGEERRVAVERDDHLLIHLLRRHRATEDDRRREVLAVARVARRHH